MSTMGEVQHTSWQTDRRDYRLLYLGCFPIFLLAATVARALPARWRPWPPASRTNSRSILGEARAAAEACLPYAMMG